MSQFQQQPYSQGYPPAASQANGLAIASLVSGLIICLTPVTAIVAIVTGILGLRRSAALGGSGRGLSIAGIALGGFQLLLVPLMIAILLPSLGRARQHAQMVQSGANMRQIGTAAMTYAIDHNEQMPPDLGTLAATGYATDVTIFLHPREPRRAPGTLMGPELTAWVNANTDYVYLGAGRRLNQIPPTRVMAHEKPEHATAGRINVLFFDGSVQAIPLQEFEQLPRP